MISAPVYVPAVPDSNDVDEETVVKHFVDDPVHADSDPVSVIFSGELRATWRPRVVGEEIDRRSHSLLFSAGQRRQCFHGPAGELDAVAAQRRPRSALTSSHGT